MGIQELEQAITQLSPKELARFRKWFDEFNAQVWFLKPDESVIEEEWARFGI